MGVISIKEYARIKSVSYEAVRQQIARYREELGDHVVKDGRQQFLDDEAVAFLDERRKKNPVVIYQENKDEELEQLRAERQQLLEELNGAKDRIIAQQDKLYELAASEQKMLLLEARTSDAEERAARAAERADHAERQATAAIQGKLEVELALEEEKERAQTLGDVAEINAQEAARAKAEAEDLRAQIVELAAAGLIKRRKIRKQLKKEGKL